MADAGLDWLYGLQKFGMKLGLDNTRALCALTGHPEQAFASVLVGGTNGKGSVSAMLQAILQAAGARTGLYTSPHLIRPQERIRLSGRDIASEDWDEALRSVREAVAGHLDTPALPRHPTYFEAMTVMAFFAFRRHSVEVAILEVGLGGRFDSTNVAEPLLSVVCGVELDHQEQLGSDLASIASEKAGIFRPGRPALTAEEKPEALAVLRDLAAAIGARLESVSETVELDIRDDGLAGPPPRGGLLRVDLRTPVRFYRDLAVPLPGRHQARNLALAVRAAEVIAEAKAVSPSGRERVPPRVNEATVREGLRATRWPGRMEWVTGQPALLLDAAHNPAGAAALADGLRRLAPRRRVLLFAAMQDKDYASMAAALAGAFDALVTTRPPLDRAAAAADLLEAFRRLPSSPTSARAVPSAVPAEADDDVAAALPRARALAGPDGIVCVAGSIFLLGSVCEILQTEGSN